MIWAVLFVLSVLLIASVWLNVRTLRQNMQLNDQREELVDVIEESLDVLDNCYTRIAHASEIPVLYDEPIIRNLLIDIKKAKNAVLTIAGRVVIYGQEKGVDPEGNE